MKKPQRLSGIWTERKQVDGTEFTGKCYNTQILYHFWNSISMLSLIRDIFQSFGQKSIIIPICKKGDADSPNNYRGVSLLSVVSKIFTYIWRRDLQSVLKKGTNCQKNNRASEPATRHRSHFHPHIDYSKSMAQKEAKVFVAFVDCLKAFDIVDRRCLWARLSKKGPSRKMLNILKSMYENVLYCVRSGHDYTWVLWVAGWGGELVCAN